MKFLIVALFCCFLGSAAADPAPAPAPAAPAPAPAVRLPPEPFLDAVAEGALPRIEDMLRRDPSLANAERVVDDVTATALSTALKLDNVQTRDIVLKMLIQNGADVNQHFGEDNDTPLIDAVRRGDLYCLNLFLSVKHPGLQVKNGRGESAASLARRSRNKTLFELLRKKALSPEFKAAEQLKNDAFRAASANDVAALSAALDKGFDLKSPRNDGETILSVAAASGAFDVVRFAIDRKAAVNARNMLGSTPLMAAFHAAKPEIAKLLLSAGASPDSRDFYGATALMQLAMLPPESKPESFAVILLDAGASPDLRDRYGATALMYAVRRGNPELVRILLEAGADRTLSDSARQTPDQMTADPNIKRILRETVKKEKNISAPAAEVPAVAKPVK